MDNCVFTAETWFNLLSYEFLLQLVISNDYILQNRVNTDALNPEVTNFLGLRWNRHTDTIFTKVISWDSNANTKHKIISTSAPRFPLFCFNCYIMDRNSLFWHCLQSNQELQGDDVLLWNVRISGRILLIKLTKLLLMKRRDVWGKRTDEYRLVGSSDSSKDLIVHFQNLCSGDISFSLPINKIESKSL